MRNSISIAIKIIAINLVIFGFLFIIEMVARGLYPEFKNETFSDELIRGMRHQVKSDLKGYEGISVRVPHSDYKLKDDVPIMLLAGDSISYGYGLAYEDIYWNRFQRLVSLVGHDPIQVVSIGQLGNNVTDVLAKLEHQISSDNKRGIRFFVYQFNYNDITPYGKKEIEASTSVSSFTQSDWFVRFAKFRYEYINRSVLMRVVQNYAGAIIRRNSGNCESRGLNALESYTWTFGHRSFEEQSEVLWDSFETDIKSLAETTNKLGIKFVIFISPILYDIDRNGRHPYYNKLNLDFSCAKINPRERLQAIAKRLEVDIIDPTEYLRMRFEARIQEGNFVPFYFPGDDNHITAVASEYVADYMFSEYLKRGLQE